MNERITGRRAIYIDVEDTLIRSSDQSNAPRPDSVDYVRRMHSAGHQLFCWSRAGGDFARGIAISLNIAHCFSAFLPKPDVCLDDSGDQLLDHCLFVHPDKASMQ